MLKFSSLKNNSKLNWMGKTAYSISLLSGHSCPNAHLCNSRVIETKEGRRIKDGLHIEFRCFSASAELIFKKLYEQRKHNFEELKQVCQSTADMAQLILNSLPKDATIIRIHVAGDYFNQRYFDAWLTVAAERPNVIFYSYTKSIKFWVNRLDKIPTNFRLTGSIGGLQDDLIHKHSLRYCQVVHSEYAAKKLKLPVDSDDKHAMLGKFKDTNFALVLHGQQKAGTVAARVWKEQINGKRKFHGYKSKTSFGKYYKKNKEGYHSNVKT